METVIIKKEMSYKINRKSYQEPNDQNPLT